MISKSMLKERKKGRGRKKDSLNTSVRNIRSQDVTWYFFHHTIDSIPISSAAYSQSAIIALLPCNSFSSSEPSQDS